MACKTTWHGLVAPFRAQDLGWHVHQAARPAGACLGLRMVAPSGRPLPTGEQSIGECPEMVKIVDELYVL